LLAPPVHDFFRLCLLGALAMALALASGCGLNKSRLATEQLVVSDAVDRAVATIDFSPLSGRQVHFDTKYLANVKLTPNGNTEYVISSLRQQMAAYDVRLMDKPEEAEFIVEARVGVLGNDGQELTYGIPGTAAFSTASVFLAAPIPAPAMPELSLGRRNHQQGTAKIGMFAYDRETREPVWQAGLAKGSTRARDLWVLGLGPFESSGPVRGRRRWFGKVQESEIGTSRHASDPHDAYAGAVVFERALKEPAQTQESQESAGEVQTVAHEEPAKLIPPTDTKPAAGTP
jgi:hypothetical protein